MEMCYVFKQPKYAAWIQNVLNQILTHSSPVTGQKHPEVTASWTKKTWNTVVKAKILQSYCLK